MSRYNNFNTQRGRNGTNQGRRETDGYFTPNDPQQQQIFTNSNRNNGGGRRGYRRGGMSNKPKDNLREPLVAREKHTDMPQGQYLSKTTSELKNDPLYMEAFFPLPSEELCPVAEELNHFPGFDGLTGLINESYNNFCAHSLNFKRSVSPATYYYYVAVLSWARVLYLKRLNKYKLTTSELEFVDMIYEQGNYILPKSVTIYLSGFGNFNIPSGVESKFNTKPYTYGLLGYFKSFDTALYLCSYPNISICAERIMRDLAYTENNELGEEWSPNEVEHEWNSRCIGYAPSIDIPVMQQQILNSAGVRSDNFPSDCNELLVNIRLMNAVQKYLSEIPSLESGPIPTNLTGSQGQFIIEEAIDSASTMMAADEISSISFVSKSPLACPGSLSYLGGTFLYRVDKVLTPARRRFFFPYTVTEPTVELVNQLNFLNTEWSPIFHNIYHYSNVPFKPNLRLKKFCSVAVKPASM